jgi:hypothetical protein
MRQQYETPATLAAENATIKAFCKEMGLKAHKNPAPYYQIDYSLEDPETSRTFAQAEVKRRFHNHGDFGTLLIALNKFKTGAEYHEICGLDFYIIIEFNDGIWFYQHQHGDKFSCVFGGRTTNTRDTGDLSPVIHIPLARFNPLSRK